MKSNKKLVVNYLIYYIITHNYFVNFRDLSEKDLLLLCDLFYLPFEHGPQSVQYLTEFNWLKSNAHLVSKENLRKLKKTDITESKPEVSIYLKISTVFKKNCDQSIVCIYNCHK